MSERKERPNERIDWKATLDPRLLEHRYLQQLGRGLRAQVDERKISMRLRDASTPDDRRQAYLPPPVPTQTVETPKSMPAGLLTVNNALLNAKVGARWEPHREDN